MKIAIIGGGLSGIAAAYTLLSDTRTTSVHLFEAAGQYGGRARTDITTFPGHAFDMGPLYIQDPGINPLAVIAAALGFKTIAEDATYKLRVKTDEGWVDRYGIEGVTAVAERIRQSYKQARQQPNVMVSERPLVLAENELLGHAVSPYGPVTESAETWQYIAADRFRETKIKPWQANLFVERGIGTLVKTYGERLADLYPDRYAASLGARVTMIGYDASGATVTWSDQQKAFDACIVAVPVSVLASNAIQFEPQLPLTHRRALKSLKLGSYKKLALGLREDLPAIEIGVNYFLSQLEPEPRGVWQYFRLPHSPRVLFVHAAGDFAAALDDMQDETVLKLFKNRLAEAYGVPIAFTGQSAVTNWTQTPGVHGAYSYTAVDPLRESNDAAPLEARIALAAPVKRVHFAGEALNTHCYGTLQAAYFEGARAAWAVLAGA